MTGPEPGGVEVPAVAGGPTTEEDEGADPGVICHGGIAPRRRRFGGVFLPPGQVSEDPRIPERAVWTHAPEHHHLLGGWVVANGGVRACRRRSRRAGDGGE